ncbi:hypothetical protein CHU93_06820 [Sandarakinorhabdus cyanobacteriorum]|uniref:DUF1579 domain-containing protein n=1 Tax=Sandarakinorhabdus cyanobacteriorum TaxID=1981098 RepID=A0A255YLJ9_9SPHN|nr:hypothetical protein [Sandarakinorhabdus cyanobacteriorum]OYQ30157.1 hypothetical protein CHU93_06820 [Sandarakinorhabdus cyanobacteriorum]
MSLAVLLAAASIPSLALPPPSPLNGLAGCWRVTGTVEGKPTTAIARGSRRLGGHYLLFELHGLNPKDPYDAAIIMAEAGPGQLTAWWMDSFGGPGSAAGKGGVVGAGFLISYDYGSAVFINRFTPQGQGWRWQIDARPTGKPATAFARYTLSPGRCGPGFSVF